MTTRLIKELIKSKPPRNVTIKELVVYEIYANPFVPFLGFTLGHRFVSWYISKKVVRKYKRYIKWSSKEIRSHES